MTNKTFKELCKELKKAQNVRKRAIKKGNSTREEQSNTYINNVIADMKANKDYFVEKTASFISQIAENDKQYNILMKDYNAYEKMAVEIEKANETVVNNELISDSQINKILGKTSKKVAIVAGSLAAVLGLTTLGGAIGNKLNNKDKNKDYTNENTTEYVTTEEKTEEFAFEDEAIDLDQNISEEQEYDTKEVITIRFKSEETQNQENTNENTNTNNSNTQNNKQNTNDNETTKNTNNKKSDEKNTKNKDSKSKNTDSGAIKSEKTDDNKNSDNKSTTNTNTNNSNTNTETNTNTNSDSNIGKDYIIPSKEENTKTTVEETKPEVPSNMPIDESYDPNEEIEYYDINGNKTSKEDADKSYEETIVVKQSPIVETQTTIESEVIETNNNDSNVGKDYIIPTKEEHTDIIIEETTEVPSNMPVEEDLITEYKAVKAQLEETKALLESQENDNTMSLSL